MSRLRSLATALLLAVLLAPLGCGEGASTAPPTPEEASSQPPLPTPEQQNAEGFSATEETPP